MKCTNGYICFVILVFISTINAQSVNYTSISSEVCVVIAPYSTVDCSLLPPEQQPGSTAPYPCPGLLDPTTPRAAYLGTRDPCYIPPSTPSIPLNGSQIEYGSLEEALAQCPFDPVYIEIVGTVYITASAANLNFWYNQTKDLIISGITQELTSAPYNTTTQVLQNVTVFNATSNTSQVVQQYINVTTTNNGTASNVSSTLVGFKNLQVLYQNISIVLNNLILDGCFTNNSMFLTQSCEDRCNFNEPFGYCPGYYFQDSIAAAIYNQSICQRTGAYFDGYRAVSVGPLGDTNYENQNTATPAIQVSSFEFSTEMTLEMWLFIASDMSINTAAAGNLRIVDLDNSGYGWVWAPNITTPVMKWCVSGGDGNLYCIPVEVGLMQWTHLAGTFSNGTSSVYLNGIFQGSSLLPIQTIGYNYNRIFSIGQSNIGDLTQRNFFNGTIDEVRVWNVARDSTEIFGNYSVVVDPLSTGLVGYWRFDEPLGAETDYYLHNLVAIYRGNPSIDSQLFVSSSLPSGGYTGDPEPVPDCFCNAFNGLCVPTELDLIPPPDAIDSTIGQLCPGDCEFINGVLIDPNDVYGVLWLPGVVNITGPFYNPVTVIIPGEYWDVNGQLVFVPGATPDALPPIGPDSNNPYFNQTGFLSGWFANGGQPPFTWFNFFPGVFMNLTSPADQYQNCTTNSSATNVSITCINVTVNINGTNVTTLNCTNNTITYNQTLCVPQNIFNQTTNCSADYLTFVPGIQWNNGNFTPFNHLDPMFIASQLIIGDLCFNPLTDISPCDIPPSPLIGTVTHGPVEESVFGCAIGGNYTAPATFNSTSRDPCFILSTLRSVAAPDSHHLPLSVILDCVFGPNDIEPAYLDPTQRDPCWVLKELMEQTPEQNCTQEGGVYVPPLYMPCLKNQNLTIIGVIVQDYYADKVVCQYACDEFVIHRMHNSHFVNTPSTALWLSGMQHYDIHDNTFCPCGGCNDKCIYINTNHVTSGQFIFYNIRQCAATDTLPVECDYDITTTLRCHDGVLYCLDVGSTIINGCQQVEVSPGVVLYDSDCAIYTPCTCGSENITLTLSNGAQQNVTVFNQPLSIQLQFFTPILAQFVGSDGTLNIPCPTSNNTVSSASLCAATVNVTVPQIIVYNATTNITVNLTVPTIILVPCNATASISNSTGNLTCPCAAGFNPNNTLGGLVGSQVNAGQNCSWPIPGGPAGEICLNSVVQCPFSGGTFGTSNPPPTPLDLCYNGMATLTCNNMTCVNNSITFEYINYPCDLNTNPNGTCATQGTLQVACMCESPGIITSPIQCQRNVTCFESTPCPANDTLCANNCTYIYGDVSLLCEISANQTMCNVCAYNTNLTSNLTQGNVVLGCSDFWIPPPPGPCTCNYQFNGTACSSNSTSNNTNCTFANPIQINTGDPTLQLYCNPDSTVSCRCNGLQATNLSLPCGAVNPNATAIVIDHIDINAHLMYLNTIVTQGLPYGLAVNRIGFDLIKKFPLKVPHWETEQSVIHEISRNNPLILGTVHDLRDGYLDQWNVVFCDSGCHQNRPKELTEACVVDQTYNFNTPGWNAITFNTINTAIFNCKYPSIIVHKGQHVYEETIYYQPSQNNHWLGSYDGAIIVASGHTIAADNITLRGLTFVHPRDTVQPLITLPSTDITQFNTPNIFSINSPVTNFTVLNCVFRGQGSSDTGAIVGIVTNTLTIMYNLFTSFQVRTLDVVADFNIIRMNTFQSIGGRAVRLRSVPSFIFELNGFFDCTGITDANNVDMVHIEITGSAGQVAQFGTPNAVNTNSIKYAQLYTGQGSLSADIFQADSNIDPNSIGCNVANNPSQVCYFRGNRHSNPPTYRDQSFTLYHILGGNMTVDMIVDNTGNFGEYCMIISFDPSITPLEGSELFKRNALCRTYFTRQLQSGADFAFQLLGSPIYYTCSFPNCLAFNESYPAIQVNPRHDLTIVPFYGFMYINNLTDCATFSLTMNMCNVTTGKAIIRRENIQLWLSSFFEGCWYCSFCCAKPIVRGSQHFIGNDTAVITNLNFRYEYNANLIPEGTELMLTQREMDGKLIYLRDNDFDGQNLRGLHKLRVLDIIMGEFESTFSLIDCNFYNWYHFPNGTYVAGIEDPRGIVPVIVQPDGHVFFKQRAPGFTAVFVQFAPLKTLNTVQFALPIPQVVESIDFIGLGVLAGHEPGVSSPLLQNNKQLLDPSVIQPEQFPFISPPNSKAVIIGNYFIDFDGKVLDLIRPCNLYMVNNTFDNCGVRQPDATTVVNIEGNHDSFGQYFMKNNTVWQYKEPIFPVTAGRGNHVKFSCFDIHGFGDPTGWVLRNNTCLLVVNYTCLNLTAANSGLFGTNFNAKIFYQNAGQTKLKPSAFFSNSGFNFLGWDTLDLNSIQTLNLKASDITGSELSPAVSGGMTDFRFIQNDPNLNLDGSNAYQAKAPYASGVNDNSYSQYQRIQSSQNVQNMVSQFANEFAFPSCMRGFPIGLRLWDISGRTMEATRSIEKISSPILGYQPSLFPLRIIADENGDDTQSLIAEGIYTISTLPFNGPGFQGAISDIVYCPGFHDVSDKQIKTCAICNDGCPVINPPSCIVDRDNSTFIPANPYFGTWLFTSLNTAVAKCQDPKKNINVVAQSSPYRELFNLQGPGDFNIFSTTGAVLLIKGNSFIINAHGLTFKNLTFVHGVGDQIATIVPGNNVLSQSVQNLTFNNCTFMGEHTLASAFQGVFEMIAIEYCFFFDYEGPRIINITANCGAVYIESCVFNYAAGAAISINKADIAVVSRNILNDCGGNAPNELACIFVDMCLNSTLEVIIASNQQIQTGTVAYPQTGICNGHVAAIWLNGLNMSLPNMTKPDLSGNFASGLPVGIRISNMSGLSGLNNIDSRANPQYIFIHNLNIHVLGTWHNIITAWPCLDALINSEPMMTTEYYCDGTCEGTSQRKLFIFILLAFGIFMVVWFAWTYFFRVPDPIYYPSDGPIVPIIASDGQQFGPPRNGNTLRDAVMNEYYELAAQEAWDEEHDNDHED